LEIKVLKIKFNLITILIKHLCNHIACVRFESFGR